MPASTLLLPSSGSKTQTYLPVSAKVSESTGSASLALVPITGASSSSEASVPSLPVYCSAALKTSFVMTSNFFWSSPCTLTSPSSPSSSACLNGAVLTSFEMTFDASRMELKTEARSLSMTPRLVDSMRYLLSVMPVCSQTSEKSSGLTRLALCATAARRRRDPAAVPSALPATAIAASAAGADAACRADVGAPTAVSEGEAVCCAAWP
mmetsp:Transcript_69619/g.175377  ORF Transcript_69619/g.175377 Transcript_69619/m.175377 type:complete len:209 (-) Transcript_69619:206-832(-)